MADRSKFKDALRWADLSVIGMQFPVAIVLGYLFGRWLDGMFGSEPWLAMVFALMGVAAGFFNLFRMTAKASREADAANDPPGAPPPPAP